MNNLCITCYALGDSCICDGDDFMPVPATMIVTISMLFAKGYDVIGCSEGSIEGDGATFISFSKQYDFKILPNSFEYAYEADTGTSVVVSNIHLKMEDPIARQRAIIEFVGRLLDWAIALPDAE